MYKNILFFFSVQILLPQPSLIFVDMELHVGDVVCYYRSGITRAKPRKGPGKNFQLTDNIFTNGQHFVVEFMEGSWVLVAFPGSIKPAGWLLQEHLIPCAPERPVPL